VLAVVDDLGWADVGFQAVHSTGTLLGETPRLDELAASGVVFGSMYGGCECTPSRAMLLTGRHAVELGLQDSVIHGTEPRGLRTDAPTLADAFRERAYRTVCVGKWHLGFFAPRYLPRQRGFDSFFGILTGGGDHYSHETTEFATSRGDAASVVALTGRNLWEDDGPWNGTSTEHTTWLYGRRTVEELRRSTDVFAYLAYQAVHGPVQADEPCASGSRMCGMIRMLDTSLGEVADELRTRDDWLFWFVSDNGGVTRHGSSNAPLRGQKGEIWEGGVRLVSFVAGTGIPALGRPSPNLAHLVDVGATALSWASPEVLAAPTDPLQLSGRVLRFDDEHRQFALVNRNSAAWGGGGALVYKTAHSYVKLVVENSVGDAVLYRAGRDVLRAANMDPDDLVAALDARRRELFPEPLFHLFDLAADPSESSDLFHDPSYASLRRILLDAWATLDDAIPSIDPALWLDDGPLANPLLFDGAWRPWRDNDGLPLATYQLRPATFASESGEDSRQPPAAVSVVL